MTRQEILREWLQKLIPLLNHYNVNYWLDFGTLLGAVRDKDVIAWDLDADISYVFTPEDRKKIVSFLPQTLDKTIGPGYYKCHWDGGIKLVGAKTHLDIYPWLVGDTVTKHPQQCFGIPKFPTSDIEQFEWINFLGVSARIPSRYDERLTRLYGNYKEPPPPNQRGKNYWNGDKTEEYHQKTRNL